MKDAQKAIRLLVLSALVLVNPFSASAQEQSEVSVTVKSAPVRSKASPLAPAVFTVSYGDSLRKVEGLGGWMRVKSSRGTGYIHESAVKERDLVLSTDSGSTTLAANRADVVNASKGLNNNGGLGATELTLPGEGFSAKVERIALARLGGADANAVEKIMSVKTSDAELASFVREGRLTVEPE